MKKSTSKINKLLLFTGILISTLYISSCTKTETQPYEKEIMARLISFKIVNTSTELIGAINNDEKTITVTIPAGQFMTSLEPEVKVCDGCTLQKGADTLITNMVNYFIKGSTIQYPVTATDGSSSIYTLKIKTDQPELAMNEVSADASNPISYDQTLWSTNNYIYIYNKSINYPYNSSYENDLELARASLVDSKGKEYPFNIASTGTPPSIEKAYMLLDLNKIEGRITGSGSAIKYHQVPAAGDYYIKLRYYSREITLKNPIRIFYNN